MLNFLVKLVVTTFTIRFTIGMFCLLLIGDNFDFYKYSFYTTPLLILTTGFFINSRFISPLNSFRTYVADLADGHFENRFQFQPNHEFTELASDLNHLAQKVDEMIQSERSMSANFAHEIRLPLTRMGLYLEFLKAETKASELVSALETEIHGLASLSNRLLKLAQWERGETKPRIQWISTFDFLNEIKKIMCPLTLVKPCQIRVLCDKDYRLPMEADGMQHAIENIIENAIRYTTAGSEILIECELDGEWGLIRVSDQGPGVPEEDLIRIFKRFERVEASRDRKSGGVGLGLSIAFAIVKSHGGTVCAYNRNPGLSVEIRIPANSNFQAKGKSVDDPVELSTGHEARRDWKQLSTQADVF